MLPDDLCLSLDVLLQAKLSFLVLLGLKWSLPCIMLHVMHMQ